MKATLTTAIALFMMGVTQAEAATLTLYNGSLNTAPNAQDWIYNNAGSQTVAGGGTTLDTLSSDGIQAGYGRLLGPSLGNQYLNRTNGFTLRFSLGLNAEDHSNPSAQNNPGTDAIADRAGLSLTLLSDDGLGIELGFWQDRIWAQEDGPVKADPNSAPTGTRFTQAEGADFDVDRGITLYALSILNNQYFLYADGNEDVALLSGRLRDYSPEGLPYTLSRFIFIGDNTSSARASFTLTQVALEDAATTPVPVPGAVAGLAVLGLGGLVKRLQASSRQTL